MSRHPKPSCDFAAHASYVATVRIGYGWGYSEPYGMGRTRHEPYFALGESFDIVMVADCGDYVSALTRHGHWINVWCKHNTRCDPAGVNFCELQPGVGHSP